MQLSSSFHSASACLPLLWDSLFVEAKSAWNFRSSCLRLLSVGKYTLPYPAKYFFVILKKKSSNPKLKNNLLQKKNLIKYKNPVFHVITLRKQFEYKTCTTLTAAIQELKSVLEPEENNSPVSRATMSIPQRGKTLRVLFLKIPCNCQP